MRSCRIAVLVPLLLLLLCAVACRRESVDAEPMKAGAREAALAAVGNLRNLLNTSGCQEIYD
jgi:hypothetical protein